MTSESTSTIDELRHCGLRVTAARCAVLEWLESRPHATAEQVHNGVAQRLGAISRQAVYDVLAACVDVSLVRQIRPAGHPARFERRAGDNHHHLVCRNCGHIADTNCRNGIAPCVHPAQERGFVVDQAEIVFWGLCQCCQHESDPSGNPEIANGQDEQNPSINAP